MRLQVHDIVTRGNAKTKDFVIEAEVPKAFQLASTMQELLQVAGLTNEQLRQMEVFDSTSIMLDASSLTPQISSLMWLRLNDSSVILAYFSSQK